jgi:hypothetical protein
VVIGLAVVAGGVVVTNLGGDQIERRRDDYDVCAELVAAVSRYRTIEAGSDILAIRAMLEDLDVIAEQAAGTRLERVANAAAKARLQDTPDRITDFRDECDRRHLIESSLIGLAPRWPR